MRRLLPLAALLGGVLFVGCNDKETPKAQSKGSGAETAASTKKHDSWWCSEHGIPEDECLMCKFSEDDLKKKGDWCEHEYAKSQCFVCNPELRKRYAAVYKDKYGKEPPEPKENPVPANPKK